MSYKDLSELSEHQHQKLLCERLTLEGIEFASTPNGFNLNIDKHQSKQSRGRKFGQIKKLKAEGMKKGFPDLIIPELFLFIEMKDCKEKARPEQKEWIKKLANMGYEAHVCNGYEQAWAVIANCLKYKIKVVRKLKNE